MNNEVYLVPDIDDTAGYNTSDPGWYDSTIFSKPPKGTIVLTRLCRWDYWGPLVQGVFSWEVSFTNHFSRLKDVVMTCEYRLPGQKLVKIPR